MAATVLRIGNAGGATRHGQPARAIAACRRACRPHWPDLEPPWMFRPGDEARAVCYAGLQTDIVYDFEDGIDRIDLSNMVGYDSFEDFTVQYNDGHLVILMGADSIVLVGTSSAVG
jgi:hypothetical protein